MWHGTARSNYVEIVDMEGLEESLAPFDTLIVMDFDRHGKVGFRPETDDGGWPSAANDDAGDEVEFDPTVMICPFMADGEVLVTMESGADKYSSITGSAVAYQKDGTKVFVFLDDIYKKAVEAFGIERSAIGSV